MKKNENGRFNWQNDNTPEFLKCGFVFNYFDTLVLHSALVMLYSGLARHRNDKSLHRRYVREIERNSENDPL